MKNKTLTIICSVTVSLLIFGGVFDRLNQFREEQIRKSAIEELSVKNIEYLPDNISTLPASQGKTEESASKVKAVNFFSKLHNDNEIKHDVVQYIALYHSATSPDSIFRLLSFSRYYVWNFLLAIGVAIMIIIYHQYPVTGIALNDIDNVKKSTILSMRQQAIGFSRRSGSGLIMPLILTSSIGRAGYCK